MLALVLKRVDYRDYDQLITLLTPEQGKITALARGVKKIVSKNSAYLEPFFLVEIEIIPGKEVKHITKVVGLNSFKKVRMDLSKSIAAQRIMALADKLIEEHEADAPVFKFIVNWLETLEEIDFKNGYFFGFITRLFKILGLAPSIEKCIFCGKIVPEKKNNTRYFFSPSDGGLICSECRQNNTIVKIVELNANDMEIWRVFLNDQVDNWPNSCSRALEIAVQSFVKHHSHKKLDIISKIL